MRNPLSAALATGIILTATFTSGCGPDCQSTCNRLYQEVGADGCDIQSPGSTRQELLQRCADDCESALDTPGQIGSYNPFERSPSNISVELANDRQAALWMECVADTSCEFLDQGYCEPVY